MYGIKKVYLLLHSKTEISANMKIILRYKTFYLDLLNILGSMNNYSRAKAINIIATFFLASNYSIENLKLI